MNVCGTETRRVLGAKNRILGYVPYEADETGGTLPRTFPGLARNQHLKRGGYLMMGRVAGPDPLLGCSGQHSSHDTGVDRRSEVKANDALRCWSADRAGQRRTHRCPGGLWMVSAARSDREICCDAHQTCSPVRPRHLRKRPSRHHHW